MGSDAVEAAVEEHMDWVVARSRGETEFHQAVREVVEAVMPFVLDHPEYREARLLERLSEPDRTIMFRVTWEDDGGRVRVNRGYRVQFSNAIGPYKGGLRFQPTVDLSVLKFLGFEQVFKNSLTGLPMGGAKGGSDFDPRGRSDREVMRFCQAFMLELHRHIGEHTDVPAGDVGVGQREISFLFGQYLRLANRFSGILTGKGLAFGGSLVRREATGYGAVYFVKEMLARHGESLDGRTVAVSGAGNVALYCIDKLVELGAKVVTVSDSDGFVHDPAGFDPSKVAWLKELKEERRGRVREYAEHVDGATFHPGDKPWGVPVELAIPCATQNEIDGDAADALLANGVKVLAEGANMPCTPRAARAFRRAGILFAPGKAVNAGGVAVSGFEQSQNALRVSWSRAEVDRRLKDIMVDIHDRCASRGEGEGGRVDYVRGANVAGFQRVASALLAYGIV